MNLILRHYNIFLETIPFLVNKNREILASLNVLTTFGTFIKLYLEHIVSHPVCRGTPMYRKILLRLAPVQSACSYTNIDRFVMYFSNCSVILLVDNRPENLFELAGALAKAGNII